MVELKTDPSMRAPAVSVLMLRNGRLQREKALDFGDHLAQKKPNGAWMVWLKGAPILAGSKWHPVYTWITCPEVCKTLSETEFIQIVSQSKAVKEHREGFSNFQEELSLEEAAQKMISEAVEPPPRALAETIKEYGGITVRAPATQSKVAFMSASQTQLEQPKQKITTRTEIPYGDPELPSPPELGVETINPSALFDDKSQAERLGNVVHNADEQAARAMVQAAQKPSKAFFAVLFILGMFVGGVVAVGFVAWSSGGINLGGSPHVSSPIPPPAPGNAAGFIGNVLVHMVSLLL
ncbi:MAG: hypothetical protein ACRDF4_08435 [Rhabdochlamydiaceae bacterium]